MKFFENWLQIDSSEWLKSSDEGGRGKNLITSEDQVRVRNDIFDSKISSNYSIQKGNRIGIVEKLVGDNRIKQKLSKKKSDSDPDTEAAVSQEFSTRGEDLMVSLRAVEDHQATPIYAKVQTNTVSDVPPESPSSFNNLPVEAEKESLKNSIPGWADVFMAVDKIPASGILGVAVVAAAIGQSGSSSASHADTTRPTILLTSEKSSLSKGETAKITFTLSEASTNFTVDDVTVSGGTLSNFTGSGTTYTATFTPAANSTVAGSVSVASGKFSDAAGNQNADGAEANNTVALAIDTVVPTLAITSDKASLAAGQTATITFTLSEVASDFAASDVVVAGGTLSNFTGSGTSYTATFTPAANSTVAGSVSVASGKFSDAAGNQNADGSEANNTVALAINTVTASSTVKSLDGLGTADSHATFDASTGSFAFTDDVTLANYVDISGFGADDTLAFQNLVNVSALSFGNTSEDVTLMVNQGGVVSSLALVRAMPTVANPGNTFVFDILSFNDLPIGNLISPVVSTDTTAPTLAITSDKASLAAGQTATITFTLSEVASDFVASDVEVAGGTLSNFTGSGTTYTATFTPAANSTVAGSVSVASGKFSDAAGNQNADGSEANNQRTIAVDTILPVAPIAKLNGSWTVNPQVTMKIDLGDGNTQNVLVELYPDAAPGTVANWLAYVNNDYYNNLIFHRVISGFVVQAGAFTSDLLQHVATYAPIPLETTQRTGLSNLTGTIAMARTSVADSATSQFYINVADNTVLDYRSSNSPGYSVFGKVINGIDIVNSISNVETGSYNGMADVPINYIKLIDVSQTSAGTAYSSTGIIDLTGREQGANYSYSLDESNIWTSLSVSQTQIDLGTSISAGPHTVLMRQTDIAGNAGAVTTIHFTKYTPDYANSVLDLATVSDSSGGSADGNSTDNITHNANLELSATLSAFANQTVWLMDNGSKVSSAVADSSGNLAWQVVDASQGDHVYTMYDPYYKVRISDGDISTSELLVRVI